jgi:hypothetical protein
MNTPETGVRPEKGFPPNRDALLTREQLAAALTAAGFPIRPKTIATMASRGGGPPFRKWSNRALYRWDEALIWAEARLSRPVRNTSE